MKSAQHLSCWSLPQLRLSKSPMWLDIIQISLSTLLLKTTVLPRKLPSQVQRRLTELWLLKEPYFLTVLRPCGSYSSHRQCDGSRSQHALSHKLPFGEGWVWQPIYHRDTRPAACRAATAPHHLFTGSVAHCICILHVFQQTFKYSSILQASFVP